MYVYSVECFTHVYCDSACGWDGLVETCCVVLCLWSVVLNLCCVVMFGMFCVMYGRITFSSVFAITDMGDIGLYDVLQASKYFEKFDLQ